MLLRRQPGADQRCQRRRGRGRSRDVVRSGTFRTRRSRPRSRMPSTALHHTDGRLKVVRRHLASRSPGCLVPDRRPRRRERPERVRTPARRRHGDPPSSEVPIGVFRPCLRRRRRQHVAPSAPPYSTSHTLSVPGGDGLRRIGAAPNGGRRPRRRRLPSRGRAQSRPMSFIACLQRLLTLSPCFFRQSMMRPSPAWTAAQCFSMSVLHSFAPWASAVTA
jgi:hypothetical protein